MYQLFQVCSTIVQHTKNSNFLPKNLSEVIFRHVAQCTVLFEEISLGCTNKMVFTFKKVNMFKRSPRMFSISVLP